MGSSAPGCPYELREVKPWLSVPVCDYTGGAGQMLGKNWSVNVLSLEKGVIGGAAILPRRAEQKQHEVQQQHCSFSLPKGDPQ